MALRGRRKAIDGLGGPSYKSLNVERMVDMPVRDSEDSEWAQYFPTTQALVRYRYGKYDKALESIVEADRRNAAIGPTDDVTAMNRMIEAMSHARGGNLAKARTAFDKG